MVDAARSNTLECDVDVVAYRMFVTIFAFEATERRQNMSHGKKKNREKKIVICKIFFVSCESRMAIYFRLIRTAKIDGDDPDLSVASDGKNRNPSPACNAITFVPPNVSFQAFFRFLVLVPAFVFIKTFRLSQTTR